MGPSPTIGAECGMASNSEVKGPSKCGSEVAREGGESWGPEGSMELGRGGLPKALSVP
eukprot:CAMPEP_0202354876 /NCGR_PEP_ID=MMETSP1126-20121109/10003_1 /ASSEMBLY_ACC=CAM_ASM_000457 /TAXON_ID=3047 /ORGANISM="Dunaliella tertiolecta, Strain CCMP1320" /LENGTH=57 /DNA_ID=CAMNT_0048947395 /DNA_START=148 /DNA_END=321 /DNA_ORIENTATION=-